MSKATAAKVPGKVSAPAPAPPALGKAPASRPNVAINTAIESIKKSAAAATSGEAAVISAAGQTAQTAPISHRRTQLESDFDRFRAMDRLEDGVDAIGPKGWAVLCQELGVTGIDTFVLSWSLGATQSSCITRSEWLHAAHLHKLDHLGSLKAALKTWSNTVRGSSAGAAGDEGAFTQMYESVYDFVRGDDEKLLPLDKAMRTWQVLLTPDVFPLLNTWLSWCSLEYKKPVSRDLWREIWRFSRSVKRIEEYDAQAERYPCAIDDFVEWSRAQMQRQEAKPGAAPAGAQQSSRR